MKFQQLFERASPVLYHYTTAYAALDIVKNNRFQLSISTANPSEAKLAPPGYDYFISMARTRTGDYHRYAHNGGTIFVLDGNWFNGRYPTKPVDYWERAWLYSYSDRSRESEDRVFSREPTIPADAVQQVHVLIKDFKPSKQNERVRQLLLLCKQRNLPVYFYIDEKAWRLLDTRSAVSPGYYKHLFRGERDAPYTREPDPSKPVMPRPSKARRKVLRSYFSKNYLKSWIELLHKKSSKELSKDADGLRYDLSYYSWEPNDDNRLGMEISNARKPDGGLSRKSAIEILQYMRSHNLKTTTEFRNMIADKWKQIAQAEREQKKPMAEDPVISEIYRVPQSLYRGGAQDLTKGVTKQRLQDYFRNSKPLPGHSPLRYNILPLGTRTEIVILDPAVTDQIVGDLILRPKKTFPLPHSYEIQVANVDERYRGQGLILALYDIALDRLSANLVTSTTQTPSGRRIWTHLNQDPKIKVQGLAMVPAGSLRNRRQVDRIIEEIMSIGADYLGPSTDHKYHLFAFPVQSQGGELTNAIPDSKIQVYNRVTSVIHTGLMASRQR